MLFCGNKTFNFLIKIIIFFSSIGISLKLFNVAFWKSKMTPIFPKKKNNKASNLFTA